MCDNINTTHSWRENDICGNTNKHTLMTPIGLYPSFVDVIRKWRRRGIIFNDRGHITDASAFESYIIQHLVRTSDTVGDDLTALVRGSRTLARHEHRMPMHGILPQRLPVMVYEFRHEAELSILSDFIYDFNVLFTFPFPDHPASPLHLLWKQRTVTALTKQTYHDAKRAYVLEHGDGRPYRWSNYLDDKLNLMDQTWRSEQIPMDCEYSFKRFADAYAFGGRRGLTACRQLGREAGVELNGNTSADKLLHISNTLIPTPSDADLLNIHHIEQARYALIAKAKISQGSTWVIAECSRPRCRRASKPHLDGPGRYRQCTLCILHNRRNTRKLVK